MRTIITLPDQDADALSEICSREKISRAEAIRRAIATYTQHHMGQLSNDAFGFWKNDKRDALEIEDTLRSEWDGR